MSKTSPPRVVVTGMGLMTGLGLDLAESWRGILEGRSAARAITLFDPSALKTRFAVELPEGATQRFAELVRPRNREQMTRGTMIALETARMAFADSGLDLDGADRTRVGVVAGATGTGYAGPSLQGGAEHDPQRILRNMASASAAWISLKWKLKGPSMVTSTACSSGAYALHAAHGLLTAGECDVVLAGAADSAINLPDLRGFGDLMALSEQNDSPQTAARPFDARRSGFVMGEGGGMLVLETEEHARRRGAKIHALLHRPGLSSEGYNILSPEPGGRGMARTMQLALAAARLRPEDIGYINAHGTSTQLNDLYETQAVKEVFGDHARRLAISSTKGATGHCLSAAAGVEAVLTVKALVENVLPPTVNLTEPDPELDLDYVPGAARPAELAHVLSNSFAFGGQNGVCVFSRWA